MSAPYPFPYKSVACTFLLLWVFVFLSAFRYQNLYLSGYWEYRTYKANRLPSLTLDLTPAKYYRYITQRYDSNEDMDV